MGKKNSSPEKQEHRLKGKTCPIILANKSAPFAECRLEDCAFYYYTVEPPYGMIGDCGIMRVPMFLEKVEIYLRHALDLPTGEVK